MSKKDATGYIYLIHFDRPLSHARHYVGWTEELPERIRSHAKGIGARLLAVLLREGISWRVSRVWAGMTKKDERKIKKSRAAKSSICPLCRGEPRDVPKEFSDFPLTSLDA